MFETSRLSSTMTLDQMDRPNTILTAQLDSVIAYAEATPPSPLPHKSMAWFCVCLSVSESTQDAEDLPHPTSDGMSSCGRAAKAQNEE